MINAYLAAVTKHVVAESTALQATRDAKHMFNVIASADIDNGKLVNLDDMSYITTANNVTVSNNEYFSMVEPVATKRVGLILSVPVGPDATPKAATIESNFYNGTGEIMRVYDLMAGDRFTVSANGITPAASGTPIAVGSYVVANGYDLKESTSAPAATVAFVGQIIEKITRTNGVFYKIFVRKNG